MYIFMGGLFFAILQFSYFVLLEWQFSSAWITYATVTFAWMFGIIAGLRFGTRYTLPEKWLLCLNVLAYYGLWCGLLWRPFDNSLVALYGFCVFTSGAYAGQFFRINAVRAKDIRVFLLHENNGFIAGLLVSFLGFSYDGRLFLTVTPIVTALSLFIMNSVFLPSE